MSWLDYGFYDNTAAEWLIALGVAVVVLIGLRVVLGTIVRRLASFVGATETRLDDIAPNIVKHTKFLFLLIVGVYAGSVFLVLSATLRGLLESIIVIAFLVQIGLWASYLISEWVAIKSALDDETSGRRATTIGVIAAPARIAV